MSAAFSSSNRPTFFKNGIRGGAILLAGIMMCTLAAGCADGGRAPVYPVRGQILLNGKPLAEAIVTFHLQDGGVSDALPSGHTDAEGRFALTSYQPQDGAPAGAYAISVVCFRAQPLRKGVESAAQNVVPSRYANAATSKLTATVVPGNNELPPLQVKSP
jgi:hypothetical protein